jgi:hypothetical protein
VELPEAPQVVERQVVAGEVEQRVLEHRAVPVGKHEAVAVGPCRVRRVVAQELAPEDFGDLRHAHRHAGMAGFRLLDRVHGEDADGVDHLFRGRRLRSIGHRDSFQDKRFRSKAPRRAKP